MINLELRLLSIQPWRMPTIHPSFNFASSQLKKMHLNFLRRWRKGQDVLEVKLSGWEIDENCGWASNLPDFSVAPDKNLKSRWKGFDACCPNFGTWSIIPFLLKTTFSGIFDLCQNACWRCSPHFSWKIAVLLAPWWVAVYLASLHIKSWKPVLPQISQHASSQIPIAIIFGCRKCFARLPSPKLNLQTVNFEPWYPRVGLGVGWSSDGFGQILFSSLEERSLDSPPESLFFRRFVPDFWGQCKNIWNPQICIKHG